MEESYLPPRNGRRLFQWLTHCAAKLSAGRPECSLLAGTEATLKNRNAAFSALRLGRPQRREPRSFIPTPLFRPVSPRHHCNLRRQVPRAEWSHVWLRSRAVATQLPLRPLTSGTLRSSLLVPVARTPVDGWKWNPYHGSPIEPCFGARPRWPTCRLRLACVSLSG